MLWNKRFKHATQSRQWHQSLGDALCVAALVIAGFLGYVLIFMVIVAMPNSL